MMGRMAQFKLREPLLWIHEVRGRRGKETLREVVLFVAGDEHWSTVEDPRTQKQRAVETSSLRRFQPTSEDAR
jgi:hypothetical protein